MKLNNVIIIGLMIIVLSICVFTLNVNAYMSENNSTSFSGYWFSSVSSTNTSSNIRSTDAPASVCITGYSSNNIQFYPTVQIIRYTVNSLLGSHNANQLSGYCNNLEVKTVSGTSIGFGNINWWQDATKTYIEFHFINYSCLLTGYQQFLFYKDGVLFNQSSSYASTWQNLKVNAIGAQLPTWDGGWSNNVTCFTTNGTLASGNKYSIIYSQNIDSNCQVVYASNMLVSYIAILNNATLSPYYYIEFTKLNITNNILSNARCGLYYGNNGTAIFYENVNNTNNWSCIYNPMNGTNILNLSCINGNYAYNNENDTIQFIYLSSSKTMLWNTTNNENISTATKYGICGFVYDLQTNTKLGGVNLYLKNSSGVIINKTTSTNSGFYYFALNATNTSEFDGTGLAKNNFNVTAQLTTYDNITSSTWHYPTAFEFLYGESLSPYGDISMSKTIGTGNASFVFRVYDYYRGYGIAGVTCEIYNTSNGLLFKNGTTSTNIDTYGICSISDIPVGAWQLKVYKGGYNSFYMPYTTEANRTYNIDVLLATSGVPSVSPNPTAYIPTGTPTGTPSGNPSGVPLPTGTDEGWNYIFSSIGINVDAVTMNMIFGLIIIVFLIGIVITVTTSDSTGISSKATIPAIAVMALLGLVFNCITGLWPFWILPVFAIICVIGGIWYLFGSNSGG